MKEIKLNCFAENEFCENASALKNLTISDPIDREFTIQIANQSAQNCSIHLTAKSSDNSDDYFDQMQLLITHQEKIHFKESFSHLFKQEVDLGTIAAQSINTYYFYLDFFDLVVKRVELSTHFDFLFNFSCEEVERVTVSEGSSSNSVVQPEEKPQESNRGTVLAANVSSEPKQNLLEMKLFFYLLPILFVIAFFVIIKLINGKKKKKQK